MSYHKIAAGLSMSCVKKLLVTSLVVSLFFHTVSLSQANAVRLLLNQSRATFEIISTREQRHVAKHAGMFSVILKKREFCCCG